jgi:hypothetical protein
MKKCGSHIQLHILMAFIVFSLPCFLSAQRNIYKTKTGTIDFISKAPLETIKASSVHLEGVIDATALSFAFAVTIKSFQGFNNSLQQQHFYENYMETDKFPKATFTGKLIEQVDLVQPGTYQVRAKGKLDLHGNIKERIIRVDIISTGTELKIKSRFVVPLVDHMIEVPKIVNQKIAEEIDVTVQATLLLEGKS